MKMRGNNEDEIAGSGVGCGGGGGWQNRGGLFLSISKIGALFLYPLTLERQGHKQSHDNNKDKD